MKYFVAAIIAIIFIGCSKDDAPYYFSYGDVAGKTFVYSDSSVEFLSQDSLIWELSVFRDAPSRYKLKYSVDGNTIKFESADQIREDYVDPLFGTSDYVITHYSDSFSGVFTSPTEIESAVTHGYEVRQSTGGFSSAGYANLNVWYRSN